MGSYNLLDDLIRARDLFSPDVNIHSGLKRATPNAEPKQLCRRQKMLKHFNPLLYTCTQPPAARTTESESEVRSAPSRSSDRQGSGFFS